MFITLSCGHPWSSCFSLPTLPYIVTEVGVVKTVVMREEQEMLVPTSFLFQDTGYQFGKRTQMTSALDLTVFKRVSSICMRLMKTLNPSISFVCLGPFFLINWTSCTVEWRRRRRSRRRRRTWASHSYHHHQRNATDGNRERACIQVNFEASKQMFTHYNNILFV